MWCGSLPRSEAFDGVPVITIIKGETAGAMIGVIPPSAKHIFDIKVSILCIWILSSVRHAGTVVPFESECIVSTQVVDVMDLGPLTTIVLTRY